jgi:hypothetical protein
MALASYDTFEPSIEHLFAPEDQTLIGSFSGALLALILLRLLNFL